MAGMDALSGTTLDLLADIRHSIADIIKTPVGTRVMRRDYGSHIFDLVDSPGNELGALRLIAAAAHSVALWETRVTMKSARVSAAMDGSATITTTSAVKGSNLTITAAARIGGG
ncbi:MAG: GPW/gp25 family protein [Rhodospirillaceae bacterium]|nr:GPW/gp25 family protein [Rhodospirillales bacterium]